MDVKYQTIRWWYGGEGTLTILESPRVTVFFDGIQVEIQTDDYCRAYVMCTGYFGQS